MTTQLRKDPPATTDTAVIASRDERRLARTLILGGVQYDAGHPCAIVRRVSRVRTEILIGGKRFIVNAPDVMR